MEMATSFLSLEHALQARCIFQLLARSYSCHCTVGAEAYDVRLKYTRLGPICHGVRPSRCTMEDAKDQNDAIPPHHGAQPQYIEVTSWHSRDTIGVADGPLYSKFPMYITVR
jgi:hypothetical protein